MISFIVQDRRRRLSVLPLILQQRDQQLVLASEAQRITQSGTETGAVPTLEHAALPAILEPVIGATFTIFTKAEVSA